MDTPEFDPHHPTSIAEMAGANSWSHLHTMIHRPDPPHILLVGGAGVGKSCAIRVCIPPDRISAWFRCTKDISLRAETRDRIKTIAKRRTEAGQINWIILEHADWLHVDAQAFLRRIIETSVGSSRFIFEVRDSSLVAEPILSRTVLFHAPRLLPYEIRGELAKRCGGIPDERIRELSESCKENVRWAVLQGLFLSWQQTQTPQPQTQPYQHGYGGIQEKPTPASEQTDWASVLRTMETIQLTGANPQMFVSDAVASTWDRQGGLCPWSVLALELSAFVP